MKIILLVTCLHIANCQSYGGHFQARSHLPSLPSFGDFQNSLSNGFEGYQKEIPKTNFEGYHHEVPHHPEAHSNVQVSASSGVPFTHVFENNLSLPNIEIQPLPHILPIHHNSHHLPGDVKLTFDEMKKQVANLPSVSLEQLLEEEWMAFKLTYKKSYPNQEIENLRKNIFIDNRNKIAKFNQEYSKGEHNYVQQLNPYGDLLANEFDTTLNGFNKSTKPTVRIPSASTFIPSANVNLPKSIDWSQVGAVTPVKQQGNCASCWAFAAAASLEGHWFRKTGQLVDISEQNLMDCSDDYGNEGCKGGQMDPAFEYIRQNDGVDGEQCYPYEGVDKECRFNEECIVAKCSGYVDINEGDETGMEIAVATLGPVAAGIDASRFGQQFYSNGVYFNPECSSNIEDLNHAVTVVGFGEEQNGQKYWLIKNSYGPNWGIGGYMKIARGVNHCGIATQASYPLV